jgi:hypothetical protein
VPTDAEIRERMPVWEAFAEFFLDQELRPPDEERIARALADSPYSLDQLDDILGAEVAPVCGPNLASPAGEWAGFDSEWLRQRLTSRFGRRPTWGSGLLRESTAPSSWRRVRERVQSLRAISPG